METPDLSERLCVWKGERCGGDIGSTLLPPPPPPSPAPPGGYFPPPSPPAPPPAPAAPAIDGGAAFGITTLAVFLGGWAAAVSYCIWVDYTFDRLGKAAARGYVNIRLSAR